MRRLLRPFCTLRWKLTLSAIATLMIAVVVMTGVIVVQMSLVDAERIRKADVRVPLQYQLGSLAAQLRPMLERPDAGEDVRRWLASRRGFCDAGIITEVTTPDGELRQVLVPLSRVLVVDSAGGVIASHPSGAPSSDAAAAVLRAAVDGRSDDAPAGSSAEQIHVAAPVVGTAGETLGAIYVEADTGPLPFGTLVGRVLRTVPENVVRAAPFAVVIGILLGAVTGHGWVRRVTRLRRTSRAWSKADFVARVGDDSNDELGELARDLDGMAAQLRDLLETRNRLAALEERNHIARELHDTVKQHVFSISMLLGSVDTLMDKDPVQARARLAEARAAAQQVAGELVAIIDEMRPALLERGDLAGALHEYTRTWSRTQGIPAKVVAAAGPRLPDTLQQNLLRVAQEALANVGRHSRAQSVEVHLTRDDPRVRLSVRDDGVGFDPDGAARAGFGLESMASRMRAVAGSLEVRSRAGRGTTVVAECATSEAG